jgi:hypothetical protein
MSHEKKTVDQVQKRVQDPGAQICDTKIILANGTEEWIALEPKEALERAYIQNVVGSDDFTTVTCIDGKHMLLVSDASLDGGDGGKIKKNPVASELCGQPIFGDVIWTIDQRYGA